MQHPGMPLSVYIPYQLVYRGQHGSGRWMPEQPSKAHTQGFVSRHADDRGFGVAEKKRYTRPETPFMEIAELRMQFLMPRIHSAYRRDAGCHGFPHLWSVRAGFFQRIKIIVVGTVNYNHVYYPSFISKGEYSGSSVFAGCRDRQRCRLTVNTTTSPYKIKT